MCQFYQWLIPRDYVRRPQHGLQTIVENIEKCGWDVPPTIIGAGEEPTVPLTSILSN